MPVSYERLCLVAAEKARRKEVQVQDSKNADELLEQEISGPEKVKEKGVHPFRTEVQVTYVSKLIHTYF